MANTYTQLIIQLIFAVKHREAPINAPLRVPLQKYITGVVQNKQHKLLAIYCMPDHCHILVGLHPTQSISDLVRDIKTSSSKWINAHSSLQSKFNWQEGFGAFSYSKSQLDIVVKYIQNQQEHHRKRTFREEYEEFLEKFKIEFENQFLFDWFD